MPTEAPSIVIDSAAAAGRRERSFAPVQSRASTLHFALGCVASAVLGAGLYGAAFAPEAPSYASLLVVLGALGLGAVLFSGPRSVPPLRVGDLGVTVGDPAEATRVAWCDIRRVRIEGDELRLELAGAPVRVPLAAHGRAAVRIIAEASRRIGPRVEVSPKAHERLPPLVEGDGELVPPGRLQLAGRKCAASGKSITFESDARLCERCAALYHADAVPERCVGCDRELQRSVGAPSAPAAHVTAG